MLQALKNAYPEIKNIITNSSFNNPYYLSFSYITCENNCSISASGTTINAVSYSTRDKEYIASGYFTIVNSNFIGKGQTLTSTHSYSTSSHSSGAQKFILYATKVSTGGRTQLLSFREASKTVTLPNDGAEYYLQIYAEARSYTGNSNGTNTSTMYISSLYIKG